MCRIPVCTESGVQTGFLVQSPLNRLCTKTATCTKRAVAAQKPFAGSGVLVCW